MNYNPVQNIISAGPLGLSGLSISVFGEFTVSRSGNAVKIRTITDARALAYLVLNHDTEVERSHLKRVWSSENSAKSFDSCISKLCRQINVGCELLRKPEPQTLLFDSQGVYMDLLEWEAAIVEGSLHAFEGAVKSWRERPLLDGWNEPWVLHARKQVRHRLRERLKFSAALARDHCDWDTAFRLFDLAHAVGPPDEGLLTQWIATLSERRRFTAMRRIYDDFLKRAESESYTVSPKTKTEYHRLQKEGQIFLRTRCAGRLRAWSTDFIPREQDVRDICELVRSNRLTTLVGTGGVGKTRLAVEVADTINEEFYDRAWFVGLEDVTELEDVPDTVCGVLGVSRIDSDSSEEALLRYLDGKEILLVLDNCEQLVAASAKLINRLVSECRGVRTLVTSREPLKIPGENVWHVPSLSIPDLRDGAGPDKLREYSAIRLLESRAGRPQTPFALNQHNAEAVVRICDRLEGVPLAIELAAAHIDGTPGSAQRVYSSLEIGFGLLQTGGRGTPSRHQTLRATIAWSYDLLGEIEKLVFERLCVFAGGFTEGAAAHVCIDGAALEDEALIVLHALAQKSLVEARIAHDGGKRYHLLQTIHEFAIERLESHGVDPSDEHPKANYSGIRLTDVRRRHLKFYADLAKEAERNRRGAGQIHWLNLLDLEYGNFRAALEWAALNDEVESGLQLAGSLGWYWHTRGYYETGKSHLTRYLKLYANAASPSRLRAIHWLGNMAYTTGDYAAAYAQYQEGLSLRLLTNDAPSIAVGRSSLANALAGMEKYAEAFELFEANLIVFREAGDLRNIALTLTNMGAIAYSLENYQESIRLHSQALSIFRDRNDAANTALALNNLAGAHIMLCKFDLARPLLNECLDLCSKTGNHPRLVHCLINSVALLVGEGDYEQAAMVFGYTQEFLKRIEYAPPFEMLENLMANASIAQGQLGDMLFLAARLRSENMREDLLVLPLGGSN